MRTFFCLITTLGLPAALGFGSLPKTSGIEDLSATCGVDTADMSVSDPFAYCSLACKLEMDSFKAAGAEFVTDQAYEDRTAYCFGVLSYFCGVDPVAMEVKDPMVYCKPECKDMMDMAKADGHEFVTEEEYEKRTEYCKGVLSSVCGVNDDMTIGDNMAYCSNNCAANMTMAMSDGWDFVTETSFSDRTMYCFGVLAGYCGVDPATGYLTSGYLYCGEGCLKAMDMATADGHDFVSQEDYEEREEYCNACLYPAACEFPFTYYGVTYDSCTDIGTGGVNTYDYYWCATATDNGAFVVGSGDYTECSCEPLAGGRRRLKIGLK